MHHGRGAQPSALTVFDHVFIAAPAGCTKGYEMIVPPHSRAREAVPREVAPVSTVLVVDDEPPILRTLDVNLRARGYEVQLARTGHQALALAARRHPDVVILDLGLPDLSGIEVIQGLRGWTSIPIIVLSARTAEAEKVAALDAGANDYVSKPFGMDELLARLRVALRTTTPVDEMPVVDGGSPAPR